MANNHEPEASRAAREFCLRYNVVSGPSLQPDAQVIELIAHGMESFSNALGLATRDNLIPVEEPAWALVRAMILRGFAHADAGFVCLATGAVSTVEVVSRVVLESALNVLYILEQDRVCRLYDYLAGYVTQERTELTRWEEMLGRMPPEEATVHRKEIERKQQAVDQQESIVQEFAGSAGITRPRRPWPKIADRFRAIGNEVDYRVLYVAMCSQTHNDAEDLFNTFMLGAMAHLHPGQVAREFEMRQKAENAFFARLLLYRSIEYLFQCFERYGESYAVPAIADIGSRCYRTMRELASELCKSEQHERDRFRAAIGPLPFNT
jgi:hypothetical protein